MIVLESTPGQPWRPGPAGVTVVHHDPLMRLLFLRDTHGLSIPSVPESSRPAPRVGSPASSDRNSLARCIDERWEGALSNTRSIPSQAILALHLFETGNVEPLARSLAQNQPTSCPDELDVAAYERWRDSIALPSGSIVAPAVDDYTNARQRARERGLIVLVVLPVRTSTSVRGPGGVLLVSDETYAQPDQLLLALDGYTSPPGDPLGTSSSVEFPSTS